MQRIAAIYFGRPADGAWVDVTKRETEFHDGKFERTLQLVTESKKPCEEPSQITKHMMQDFP